MARSAAWWAYCGLLLVIAIARLVQKIMADAGGPASRYLPLIVALVLVTGVAGSLRGRAIGRRWVWRAIFWLSVLASAIAILLAGYLLVAGAPISVMLLIAFVVLLLPAEYRLNRYTNAGEVVWAAEPEKMR